MEFTQEYILIAGTPIGDLQIRYYGIIIVAAMLIAATVAARLAMREDRDPEHIWGALTWAIIPGIIGARLWFVLLPPVSSVAAGQDTAWFLQNFFNLQNGAIAIWSGGLHIFGAAVGGFLGAWLYFSPLHNKVAAFFNTLLLPITIVFNFIFWVPTMLYQRVRGEEVTPFKLRPDEEESVFPDEGMSMLPWLDIGGVVFPLAQAIGRWANFVNQELYGVPTSLPWGIAIDVDHRVGVYRDMTEFDIDTRFHPLFLYESLWNFLAFFVLLHIYQVRREQWNLRPGDMLLLYLMQYAFIRTLLEFIRIEVAYFPGTNINSSQVFSVVVFLIALGLFLYRRSQAGAAQSTETQPAA